MFWFFFFHKNLKDDIIFNKQNINTQIQNKIDNVTEIKKLYVIFLFKNVIGNGKIIY